MRMGSRTEPRVSTRADDEQDEPANERKCDVHRLRTRPGIPRSGSSAGEEGTGGLDRRPAYRRRIA
jgi:hypothetical protein